MNEKTWNFKIGNAAKGPGKALVALTAAWLVLGGIGTALAAQQNSSQSVAEAARKARARKKSSKPVKTYDDDTIHKDNSQEETEQPESTVKVLTPDADKPPAEKNKSADEEGKAQRTAELKEKIQKEEADLKTAKEQLANAQKDADLAQRDYSLQKDQFYSKANASQDTAGKAKLDELQGQISTKQQEVESVKAKIVVLEDLLKKHKAEAGTN